MRIAKWLLTVVLGLLLAIDGIVTFRLVTYGWPKHLVTDVVDGAAQVHAVPIAMNASAWLSVGLYLLAHILLCYGVWRLWRPREAVHL